MAKTTKAEPTAKPIKPLHIKYRPQEWGDVIGQGAAVKVMARLIRERKSQCFLLTGPGGTGKTTLARIGAREFGCATAGIAEIDAATNSGVEYVRSITELTRYKAFSAEGKRGIIIDECHRLSAQSWDALLKPIEDSPDHACWFLCSTDPRKIPKTIKTRSTPITLKAVSDNDLGKLLDTVCEEEGIDPNDEVVEVIIGMADGSPRQMLVNLEACLECETRKGALAVLGMGAESQPVLELCRALMGNASWSKLVGIVGKIEDANWEGVRIQVANYFGAVAKNSKTDKAAIAALSVLTEFATPYNQAEGVAPLMISLGNCAFR